MKIEFESGVFYLDKLKLHYIIVTEEILRKCANKESKNIFNQRFTVRINGKIEWHAGTVALGKQQAYITLSKARMKQLNVELGDTIHVELTKDHHEHGFPIPIEFQEVLNQDTEGKRRFDLLQPGFKRHIIYLITNYKTEKTRIEKSIFYLENLKKSIEGNTTMRNIYGKDLP